MNKKNRDMSALYFVIVCIVSLIFVFSPIIIRVPIIYDCINCMLSVFKNSEYALTYVESVGAIIGALLAVTGTIWTQNIINKQQNKSQMVETVSIVYKDLKIEIDGIVKLMGLAYPVIRDAVLKNDEIIISKFYGIIKDHNININPDWKQLVASIHTLLEYDDNLRIQHIYRSLSTLSELLVVNVRKPDYAKNRQVYSLMYEFVDVDNTEPLKCKVLCKKEITQLIEKLNQMCKQ